MMTELEQEVLDILIEHIHPNRNEANPRRQHLFRRGVRYATPDALQAFLEIHSTFSSLLPSADHYRSRIVERSSSEGVGIIYYTRPVGDGINSLGTQIQSILLPTKEYRGCIESYSSGHDNSPITTHTIINRPVNNALRDGKPVFRILGKPSGILTQQLIGAFIGSSLFVQIQPD